MLSAVKAGLCAEIEVSSKPAQINNITAPLGAATHQDTLELPLLLHRIVCIYRCERFRVIVLLVRKFIQQLI